ncbi:hypothetical protein [Halorubellus litoreus]|uniref:Sulfatase-modifying factor enzyme 1 n=1 Tax=Halorubellus litoreus TaxID=755308 RepID=A0ABD5VGP6_9EURY
MGLDDPSRRRLLQVLAATGLSTTTLLGSTAGASRASSTTSSVTMNDLEYQLDYDIDRFDGQNVSNSGSVRYEQKKYAADSSFFTWQSGTWVNAGDDARKSTWTGNIYAPGAKHSRVLIEKDSTETDLYFANSYVYTDDEQDDDMPQAAWVDYAFDVAWKAIDEATPFFVPPRPPSVGEDTNETGKTTGPDGAEFTFYDPTPTTSEEPYTATHSADWRWDASGAVDPGWNYTNANRKVDVGEWLWDVDAGWTFGAEREHQLALSTAFCIYQEDETVCETDTCSGDLCIQSTDTTTSADDDGFQVDDCCTLDTVDRPIPVTDDHLTAARDRARSVSHIPGDQPRTRFEVQAARGLAEGPEFDGDFRELVAYRSAAAHARGAGARRGVLDGVVNAQNASQRASQLDNEVASTHRQVRYTGERLDAVAAEAGQVEKTLLSARTWADSADAAFDVDHLGDGERVKYAESAIAFAEGNLDDARRYLDATDTANPQATDQKAALRDLADALETDVSDALASPRDAVDDHVRYALRETRSYLDRARSRRDDGFLAAAVVDLVFATGYVRAASDLAETDFATVDEATLDVEAELVADHYNRRAADVTGALERLVLRLGSLEYNSGIEAHGTAVEMADPTEAATALRHYVATESLLDAATSVYETHDLA